MIRSHATIPESSPAEQARACEFRRDFHAGLSRPKKRIPSKYLYDARGSALFEQICELPEYYPTRTEMQILADNLDAIAELAGPACAVVEFGSGSSRKTRRLLERLDEPSVYVPIEISSSALEAAAGAIARRFSTMAVLPVCGDFTRTDWRLPDDAIAASRRLFFFPGSTIGNFTPDEAAGFLRGVRQRCRRGDALLLGVDVVKDLCVLEAAYDDRAGVTAAFNRNLLVRANRELGTDFVPARFAHRAIFNSVESRIEMHLVSTCAQRVSLDEVIYPFAADESIVTEYSYKYEPPSFRGLATRSGFHPTMMWTDPRHYFSVHWLEAR